MSRKRARESLSKAREKKQRQVRGTRQRVSQVTDSMSVSDVLPFSPRAVFRELIALVPKAFGFGSAQDQIKASIWLIVFAFLSTPFSGGASAVLAAPFMLTLAVGVVRLVPAVDSGFLSGRKRAKDATEGRRWGRG